MVTSGHIGSDGVRYTGIDGAFRRDTRFNNRLCNLLLDRDTLAITHPRDVVRPMARPNLEKIAQNARELSSCVLLKKLLLRGTR